MPDAIQCVAQTRRRQRCTSPVLGPADPSGIWTLMPATARHGQLALPVGDMAVYDLTHLPHDIQIRWRTERALQFFGGRLLHASRKGAVLASGKPYDVRKLAHPGLEVWEPTDAELRFAQAALDAVPDGLGEPLYARVGLVDGEPRLMELELVEPNLFLSLHTGSVARMAEAVLRAAG